MSSNETSLRLKKLQILLKISEQEQLFNKNFYKFNFQNINYWHNETNNFYNIITIRNIIKNLSFYENTIYNQLFIQANNTNINIFLKNLRILRIQQYDNDDLESETNIRLKKLELKNLLLKTASTFITVFNYKNLNFSFYQDYLDEPELEVKTVFQKDQFSLYFNPTIQAFETLFYKDSSSEVLAYTIYIGVKRNPQRIKFLTLLKRIIEWYFYKQVDKNILGIRTEVKGRFIAKSRTKKQILSVGNIKNHKFNNYKNIVAITKFGSLSVKVWISSKKFL